MTGFVAIMWGIWGVLVLVMLGLKIYAGRLSRNEENQLVLDSAFDNLKIEQAEIADSIHKIEPVRKASLWLVVAATVFVVGYYAVDVVNQFK
jgi:cell division protein FtsX